MLSDKAGSSLFVVAGSAAGSALVTNGGTPDGQAGPKPRRTAGDSTLGHERKATFIVAAIVVPEPFTVMPEKLTPEDPVILASELNRLPLM
jgi:hypothetical protein